MEEKIMTWCVKRYFGGWKLLDEKGIKTYRTFVGEYATSMEMAGASISICKVDEEMKGWIDMPVKTPFYTQA